MSQLLSQYINEVFPTFTSCCYLFEADTDNTPHTQDSGDQVLTPCHCRGRKSRNQFPSAPKRVVFSCAWRTGLSICSIGKLAYTATPADLTLWWSYWGKQLAKWKIGNKRGQTSDCQARLVDFKLYHSKIFKILIFMLMSKSDCFSGVRSHKMMSVETRHRKMTTSVATITYEARIAALYSTRSVQFLVKE